MMEINKQDEIWTNFLERNIRKFWRDKAQFDKKFKEIWKKFELSFQMEMKVRRNWRKFVEWNWGKN